MVDPLNEISMFVLLQPIDDDFGSVKPSQEKASKCQQCGSEDSFLTNILYCCDACGKVNYNSNHTNSNSQI